MSTGDTSVLELVVQSAIPEAFGFYETNQADLRGTPDIVFREQKVIVFVHGCYWHRHRDCPLASTPGRDFIRWNKTFNTTVRRDAAALSELRAKGWTCLVFWECEIDSNLDLLIQRLGESLGVGGF